MEKKQLRKILELHELWLANSDKGVRANLKYVYLEDANLYGADLRWADLQGSTLIDVNLKHADLRYADLSNVDLSYADLSYADLRYANLKASNLRYANLHGANLQGVNLMNVNLDYSNLKCVNLDYSCLPLYCGSIKANMDDRQVIQLLYHTLSVVKYSNNVSEELKEKLLTDDNLAVANEFHNIKECGVL